MEEETKFRLAILGFILLCVILFGWVEFAQGDTKHLSFDTRYSLEETVQALKRVQKIRDTWGGVDVDKQSKAFFEAQEKYQIPSLFLVSIGWHESRYRLSARGKLKELGVMQVGPMGRRRCRSVCGAMVTEQEQIYCGACWLEENTNWCGSPQKGFAAYATGKCKPTGAASKNKIARRYQLWYGLDRYLKTKKKEQ